MSSGGFDLKEFHWLVAMVQNIDVGLVILDKDHRIQIWNGFMENHSGLAAPQVQQRTLFELFPELPKDWFTRKLDSVKLLKNRTFTTWEQRPYIFKFKNYRPITGTSPFMYQNMTVLPLQGTTGKVEHFALIIYDVTDEATNKQESKRAREQLVAYSRMDALTQLYNRGYWQESAQAEFQRYQRSNRPSVLVMLDIDHFKEVNDTYGHNAGDQVIRHLSALIKRTVRTTDLAGRYGGEEFAILLLDTDLAQAGYFAERLRKLVEKSELKLSDNQTLKYTISIGISQLSGAFASFDAWVKDANDALYRSKQAGRNQTNGLEN